MLTPGPREPDRKRDTIVNAASVTAFEGQAYPQTQKTRSTGDWPVETDAKEDDMFSPFLNKPFAIAIAEGIIPRKLNTILGTLGAMHDTGDLACRNLVHLAGIDGTDPDSMTRGEVEGRRRAMLPKGGKSLLVAGRASGGDMVAHAAARNMACCAVAGQGAGVAAAQAVTSDRAVDTVEVDAVQRELIRRGGRID